MEMCTSIEKNFEKTKKNFLRISEVQELLRKKLDSLFNEQLFREIINKFLVVTFIEDEEQFMCIDEIEVCERIFRLNYAGFSYTTDISKYQGSFLINQIRLTENTILIYEISDSAKAVPAFVRNILYFTEEAEEINEPIQYELLGNTIITQNARVSHYLENAINRENKLAHIKSSNFANSSSYMGTKKKLVGFIIESIYPHCQENSVFLDIMCGSGAVSNALAQVGPVFASDAQSFCRLLAKIQGAGFNEKRAKQLLQEMYNNYIYNLKILENELRQELEEEDRIFHMDLEQNVKVLNDYQDYIQSYQLYSSTELCPEELLQRVNIRKLNPRQVPYCLFSCYYANVYFGLAQSVQLDSIRYAIDQIVDQEEKEWALGVLVIVTSIIGTTYGGHFAQPKCVDIRSLESILEKRGKSVWLEFSKRMICIAQESEKYKFPVDIIDGPWENALHFFDKFEKQPLVVYVDAPYKRDEYSRYYHVLETMVLYDYPSCEYKGRLRSKMKGERFSTEFFTKTISKIEAVFVKIINEILSNDAICVWSYSDNGAVSIMGVVEKVKQNRECNVFYYMIPYQHSRQGKKQEVGANRGRKSVVEYCIIFKNKN